MWFTAMETWSLEKIEERCLQMLIVVVEMGPVNVEFL